MILLVAMLKSEWIFVHTVKKSIDCKQVSNITFLLDHIYKRNKEHESCISHAVKNWHCFKHPFCRICVDTAGTRTL